MAANADAVRAGSIPLSASRNGDSGRQDRVGGRGWRDRNATPRACESEDFGIPGRQEKRLDIRLTWYKDREHFSKKPLRINS